MCDELLLYFDTSSQQYSTQQKIDIPNTCNAITVKNAGNSIVLYDDEPLRPGEAKIITGERGEILTGRHNIGFTIVGLAVPPVPRIDSAWVTIKFYVPRSQGAKSKTSEL